MLTTQAQRAEEAVNSTPLPYFPLTPPALFQPRVPRHTARYRIRPRQGHPSFAVWLMHDPAYPESLPGAPLVGTRIRKPVNCWRYMTAAIRSARFHV